MGTGGDLLWVGGCSGPLSILCKKKNIRYPPIATCGCIGMNFIVAL